MSNPVFNSINKQLSNERVIDGNNIMTVNGTIQVAFLLTLILSVSAAFVWSRFSLGYSDMANMLCTVGGVLGFILALVISFTQNKYLVPLYAVCEGFFIGGISSMFERVYSGIVTQAVFCTIVVLLTMLCLYRTGIIKCTDKFRSVILISTLSICVIYLVDFIGHFFNYAVPVINSSSNLGIGASVVIVLIAALNLIIDFDFIEQGARRMLPKNYEWYCAFGLLVTLVWLYLEILKLLAKLSDRR